MLIQFLVENFLSFKDETVFSMLAPPEETRGVVEVPAHGLRLMRIAAFYGANASGKSNLIAAMETARKLIAREQPSDVKLPARIFRLDPAALSKPSRFQFDFITEEIRYTYVLTFTGETIVAEALYRKLPNAIDEEMVYEREAPAEKGEHRIDFGPLFDARNDEDRQFARFTAKGAHARQPLLVKFAVGNVPGFATIRAWFEGCLKCIGATTPYPGLVPEIRRSESIRDFLGKMLAKMGTGIESIELKKMRAGKLNASWQHVGRTAGTPRTQQFIDELLSTTSDVDSIASQVLDPTQTFDMTGDKLNIFELRLAHSTRKGFKTLFRLKDESDGTQRLLHLLPVLFHRTQISGLCTVIDELDRSLHTTLTRHFVQEFLNMASGTQTQLIFTTHDTNLLNGRLLPARAIWFVEKDDDGASRIYSLSEYKPEQLEQLLEHLEEGYLQGRFGAIPFIADRKNLAWQADEEKPKA